VKISASVVYSKLQELSVSAESTGIIPVLSSTHCLKSMQELPGIVELTNSDSARRLIHWAEIGLFVKNIVCFENDRKGKLMRARATLSEFDGTTYSDHDLFVAEFERLFDICTSWLRRPIEDDFDKIQRVLLQCPKLVQEAYASYASDPKTVVDELNMSWSAFRVELQIVWKSAFDKLLLQEAFGLGDNFVSNVSSAAVVSYASKAQRPPTMQNQSLIVPKEPIQKSGFQDKTTQCTLCPSSFLFSIGQQEDYLKNGFENDPKRCNKCRGQQCHLFSSAEGCPYGANCKFLHTDPSSGDTPTGADSTADTAQPERRRKYPCRFFEAGRCEAGANCVFSHDKTDTARPKP
jgi:hypothetical protein